MSRIPNAGKPLVNRFPDVKRSPEGLWNVTCGQAIFADIAGQGIQQSSFDPSIASPIPVLMFVQDFLIEARVSSQYGTVTLGSGVDIVVLSSGQLPPYFETPPTALGSLNSDSWPSLITQPIEAINGVDNGAQVVGRETFTNEVNVNGYPLNVSVADRLLVDELLAPAQILTLSLWFQTSAAIEWGAALEYDGTGTAPLGPLHGNFPSTGPAIILDETDYTEAMRTGIGDPQVPGINQWTDAGGRTWNILGIFAQPSDPV